MTGNKLGYYSPRSRVSMTKDFDLEVIGGGPVGISGANTAAIFGKRVALVEKLGKVGGAGINTGTIPSKTLRETASKQGPVEAVASVPAGSDRRRVPQAE